MRTRLTRRLLRMAAPTTLGDPQNGHKITRLKEAYISPDTLLLRSDVLYAFVYDPRNNRLWVGITPQVIHHYLMQQMKQDDPEFKAQFDLNETRAIEPYLFGRIGYAGTEGFFRGPEQENGPDAYVIAFWRTRATNEQTISTCIATLRDRGYEVPQGTFVFGPDSRYWGTSENVVGPSALSEIQPMLTVGDRSLTYDYVAAALHSLAKETPLYKSIVMALCGVAKDPFWAELAERAECGSKKNLRQPSKNIHRTLLREDLRPGNLDREFRTQNQIDDAWDRMQRRSHLRRRLLRGV